MTAGFKSPPSQHPAMKYALPAVALLLLAAPAAAQATDLDVGPGPIGPDSIFYGLDVALDNAGMTIGLTRAGTVAQERAAEARQMQERNDTGAMERAVREMNAVAQRASTGDARGLQKALVVLQEVRQRAPEQARVGLDTAIGSLEQARERVGQQGPGANTTIPNGTDGPGGTRPNGSGDFNDTPGNDSGPSGNASGQ